jgi:hypothetical protein
VEINLGAATLCGQARHACNGIFHSEVESQLAITDVAVEKLICGKRSQITSRQDALQTIFSGRLGIFYLSIPKKSRRFCRYRLFQHPQIESLSELACQIRPQSSGWMVGNPHPTPLNSNGTSSPKGAAFRLHWMAVYDAKNDRLFVTGKQWPSDPSNFRKIAAKLL